MDNNKRNYVLKTLIILVFLGDIYLESYIGTYVLLGLIFLNSTDWDLRSIVVMLAITVAMRYELDYVGFYLTAHVFETGKIVGDIILNSLIIFNCILFRRMIIFRQEIMVLLAKPFNVSTSSSEYNSIVGDRIQLSINRGLYLFCMVVTIVMIGLAAVNYLSITHSEYAFELFTTVSKFFVDGTSLILFIQIIGMLSLTLQIAKTKVKNQ